MVVDVAGRHLEVALADLLHDFGNGEPLRREARAVDLHDDLALLAADQLHLRDAREHREARLEPVVRVVVERADVRRARERERDDGRRVHVVLEHLGLLGAGRQFVLDEVDLLAHVRRHHVDVAVALELQEQLAEVVRARRRHVLQAVHLRRGVLQLLRDGRLDLLRRRARIDDRDGHVGHVHRRRDVVADRAERQVAEQPQDDQHDRHRDRALQAEIRKKHGAFSPRHLR